MKELICIVCPNGCHLKVDEENGYNVTVRVVTSTVRIEGAACRRLPVKTSAAVDKDRIFDVMALLDGVTVHAPVRTGDVIVPNLFGTGVSVIACKSM